MTDTEYAALIVELTTQRDAAETALDGMRVIVEQLQSDMEGLRVIEAGYAEEANRYKELARDFMSYFDPKGGVSQVPLGPFERAKALLEEKDAQKSTQ